MIGPLRFRLWSRTKQVMHYHHDVAICLAILPGASRPMIARRESPQCAWEVTDWSDVMLWTGFCDTHGTDIYDGDILQTPFGRTAVFWSIAVLQWCIQAAIEHAELRALPSDTIEVIGNIWEAANLLT